MNEYIVFVLALYILGLLEVCGKRVEKLTLMLLIFFIGFRAELGTDWYGYKNIYEEKAEMKLEFFFEKSMAIFRVLGIEFKYYYILISLITLLILYYGMKKNIRYPTQGLVFFILSNPASLTFEQIRQFLSVAVFVYFLNFGYKFFYLGIFFLKNIHTSTLVTIFHPILKKRNQTIRRNYLVILLLVIFCRKKIIEFSIFFIKKLNFLNQEIIWKIDYYYSKIRYVVTPALYLKTIFVIIILLMSKSIIRKYPQKKEQINYYFNLAITYLILLHILLGLNVGQRILIYYQIGLNFLIIYLIMSYKDVKLRIIAYTITISFVSLTFLSYMNSDYFKSVYVPYKNYLYSDLAIDRFERIDNIKKMMEKMYRN